MIPLLRLARTGEIAISPHRSVRAALELIARESLPGLIVLENDSILGAVTNLDLSMSPPNRLILDCPIRRVSLLSQSTDILSAWKIIRKENVGIHPIVGDGSKLKGLVSFHDIMEYLITQEGMVPESTSTVPGELTIMIVDDSKVVRKSLEKTLQEAGYKTVTASSGKEALEKLRDSPDLILLDVHTQPISGYEVLKAIKANPSTWSIPVIILTAMSDISDRIEAFTNEADDYLLKPYHGRELLVRIERLLRGKALSGELKKVAEEKKQYLAQLRELREFNESIIENMGSGLVLTDLEGIVLKINQAALKILRIPLEAESLGHPITDISPVLKVFCQVNRLSQKEVMLPLSDELSVSLGFSSSYLLGIDGEKQGIITMIRDLTKNKRADEALRESEQRFRDLTESTSDWIWEVDADIIYTYASPKVKDLLGYEPKEIIGKMPFDLMLPKEARRVATILRDIAKSQESFNGLENMSLHKNGQLIVIESSGVPIFDANGGFCGYRGIDRDITERIRAEEAVRQAAAEWRTTLDTMPDIVMLLDRNQRIMRANKALIDALGLSFEEILGQKCYQCLHDTNTPPKSCLSVQAIVDGKEYDEEVYNDKLGRDFHVTVTPFLDSSGKPTGAVHVMRDITELKKIQGELRTKEKLATIGEVAGGVAHEIKNPLFAISSGIQILEHELKLDEEQKKTFEVIFQETMRVDRLIRQLLDFTARQELKRASFKITTLINEVISLNKGLLQARRIRIRKTLPRDMPPVHADRDRIFQVLVNLLQNAIDVSRRGDTLVISCDIDGKRQCAIIKVMDRGPGIPEKQRERVFDLFFSTKKGSSGMGLAISKKIILEHGGSIWVEPRKKGGTSFVVKLPLIKGIVRNSKGWSPSVLRNNSIF